MIEYLPQFLGLGLIALLAAMSPGADFAVVVGNAMRHSRRIGFFTALGVGCGILVHVFYTIIGVGFIISQSIILFSVIKYLGAAYLIYLGVQALRSQPRISNSQKGNSVEQEISVTKAFVIGFLTNALNPKATLFFLSLFTQFISAQTPLIVQVALGLQVALVVGGWFVIVAYLFSHSALKEKLVRAAHWIDRVMGTALIALGIKIGLSRQ